jgi:hypothetical protein
MTTRTIQKTYAGVPTLEGAGVRLLRIFGHQDVTDVDPFLLLDFFDSGDQRDYINGFPWHPHRGIETITYLVEGLLEHGDSLGNRGLIEPLGCQWMTAGSGIVHQEMPQPAERLLGAQLWLNLPRDHKMTEPAYRDITASDLQIVEQDGRHVKLVAGEYGDARGPVGGTYVDPLYFDISLATGGRFEMEIPAEDTVFLLMLDGAISFPSGEDVAASDARGILLTRGERVELSSPSGGRCLLMAGCPLHEPIAWGGPIVMNTREELRLAFEELDQGTFIK